MMCQSSERFGLSRTGPKSEVEKNLVILAVQGGLSQRLLFEFMNCY